MYLHTAALVYILYLRAEGGDGLDSAVLVDMDSEIAIGRISDKLTPLHHEGRERKKKRGVEGGS